MNIDTGLIFNCKSGFTCRAYKQSKFFISFKEEKFIMSQPKMKDQKDQIPQKHAQKGKSGESSSGKSASSQGSSSQGQKSQSSEGAKKHH